MHAHIFSCTESHSEKFFTLERVSKLHDPFELAQSLGHLRHRSCAKDELTHLWMRLLVGANQGKNGNRFSGSRGHLQQSLAPLVDRALQVPHVPDLLRVDRVVGEGHVQTVNDEVCDSHE